MTEQEAVIGYLLSHPELAPALVASMTPEMFDENGPKNALEAIREVLAENAVVGMASVIKRLKGSVGASVLSDWGCVSTTLADTEAIISELAEVEKKQALVSAVLQCETSDEIVAAVNAIAEDKRLDAVELLTGDDRANLMLKRWTEASEGVDENRVRFGIKALDDIVGGLGQSQLVLLAARPSIGKSALALTIANNMSNAGRPVLFASMEMDRFEVSEREASLILPNSPTMTEGRNGPFSDDFWRRGHASVAAVRKSLVCLSDASGMTIEKLHSLYHKMLRRSGCDAVFVDYVGLLQSSEKHKSRYEAVSELSRGLKNFAQKYHVPVVALVQLNREADKGENGKPTMGQLRDSGQLEADANTVILLWRKDEKTREVVDCIVAKNRGGFRGECQLAFDPQRTRFGDIAPDRQNVPTKLQTPYDAFAKLAGN